MRLRPVSSAYAPVVLFVVGRLVGEACRFAIRGCCASAP